MVRSEGFASAMCSVALKMCIRDRLYGGYDHYGRTYGFNLLPYYAGEELYCSWLQSQRNEYTKLDIFYAGLDLSTVIAKICELSLGAQFNRQANFSVRVPKPYFQSYAKLAVRPTRRLDPVSYTHLDVYKRQ